MEFIVRRLKSQLNPMPALVEGVPLPPPVRALEHPILEIDREAPPRHQLEPSRAHRERDLELDRLALAGGDLERNDEPVSRGTDRRGRDSSALAALLSRRRAIDQARRNGDAREMLPALRAALICEKLLTEADGVMSAIRIFSRLDLAPGATFEATLLLMLANVEPVATPHHRILVRLETGAAEILGQQQFPVTSPLEAGDSFSLVLPFRFQGPERETTFWLRFAYDTDDQELTRLPIQFRRPPQLTA